MSPAAISTCCSRSEVRFCAARTASSIVGGSCRTLSGSDNLGACWRVWRLIISAPSFHCRVWYRGATLRASLGSAWLGCGQAISVPSITTMVGAGAFLKWPSPDGWRVTSNNTCFYIAAPALCARDRPGLSDNIQSRPTRSARLGKSMSLTLLQVRHQMAASHSLSISFPRVSSDSSWPRLCPPSRGLRCLVVSRHGRLPESSIFGQSCSRPFDRTPTTVGPLDRRLWANLTCHQRG